jgi:hypothetical protein
VTTLQARNKRGWLFEDVHNSIMVALTTRHDHAADSRDSGVRIWPSVTSEIQLKSATGDNALRLKTNELASLTDSWVIPWFASLQVCKFQ